MQTIYQYDDRRVFTGVTRQIPDAAGAPLGWTRTPTPELGPGEWAVFSGQGGWRVVTTEPSHPPEPVPATVTRRQFMQQLVAEGLDDDVEAVLDGIADTTERKLMRSWYDDSQVFERQRPELIQVADSMGKTSDDLDQFFREANAR